MGGCAGGREGQRDTERVKEIFGERERERDREDEIKRIFLLCLVAFSEVSFPSYKYFK